MRIIKNELASAPVMIRMRLKRKEKCKAFALFPTVPGEKRFSNCICYVGSEIKEAGFYDRIRMSRPATSEESISILHELAAESISSVNVIQWPTREIIQTHFARACELIAEEKNAKASKSDKLPEW